MSEYVDTSLTIEDETGRYDVVITIEDYDPEYDDFDIEDADGEITEPTIIYSVFPVHEYRGMGGTFEAPDWEGRFISKDKAIEFAKSVYEEIRNELGIESKDLLGQVMTSSEIEAEFNLSQSTVAQAIHRGQIPARKSGGTWLIARKDAVERWGRRK